MRGNFFFVHDYGVLIITDDSYDSAYKTLTDLVKANNCNDFSDWSFDRVEWEDGNTSEDAASLGGEKCRSVRRVARR